MNSPKPSSSPVGDREAMQNASYSARRQAVSDPMKINAQDIRDTLYKAKSRAHFEELLTEHGIESVFDRHKDEKIYGWKLRVKGATGWIKASTLAKDLSWPKIAYRFMSDIQDETDNLGGFKTAVVHSIENTVEYTPSLPKPEINIETVSLSVDQLQVDKSLTKALHDLAKILSESTFELANLVTNFLKTALVFLYGINAKLASKEAQVFHMEDSKFALRLEPILPTAHDEQFLIKLEAKAVAWINKISQAILAKNSLLLPNGAGAEVIIEQMKFEETPLSAIKVAADNFNFAAAKHQQASQKTDDRPMDWREVFETDLHAANKKLDSLTGDMRKWQGTSMKNSLLALTGIGKQKEFDQQIQAAQYEVDHRSEVLSDHRRVLAAAQKAHDAKPWPRPSADIVKARDDAQFVLCEAILRIKSYFKFKFRSFSAVEKQRVEKLLASAVSHVESFAREENVEFLKLGLTELELVENEIALGNEKIRIESESISWELKHGIGQVGGGTGGGSVEPPPEI